MDILNKLSVSDVNLEGKRVFLRTDYNVPLDDGLKITNTARIDASIPTLKYILEHGARSLVVASHLGRPKGAGFEEKFSMRPVRDALQAIFPDRQITFLADCVGPEVEAACASPAPGSLILLENLRFHAEETSEEEADPKVTAFRESLRKLADVYCSDAFGTAHRPHSSMVGQFFDVKCAGFLMQKELEYFRIALSNPTRPYLAIMGGAKIHDKIKLIKNMLLKVDKLIIGGGMAFTFLKVTRGMPIGGSLYDAEGAKIVPEIMELAKKQGVEVLLPVDFVCGDAFKNDCNRKTVTAAQGIEDGWEGMDCGPESTRLFAQAVESAKTVIWNGPLGCFEMPNFAAGTNAILHELVKATGNGAITIIGGGDSATAAKKAKVTSKISHVSTGGGASLELLQGEQLPGVVRLSDKK